MKTPNEIVAAWLDGNHPMNPVLHLLAEGKSCQFTLDALNGNVQKVSIRADCKQFRRGSDSR